MNDEEYIAVIDIAAELGTRKSTIFKILKRLRITGKKRRDVSRGNQFIACITMEDYGRVRKELSLRCGNDSQAQLDDSMGVGLISDEEGVFYLIQLEPSHDPGRFKVGFAANMVDRLRQHRCSAPFAVVVKTWPCKRLWERTAIDCVTPGCESIYSEFFVRNRWTF